MFLLYFFLHLLTFLSCFQFLQSDLVHFICLMICCLLRFILQFLYFSHHSPSVSGYFVFSWTFLWKNMFFFQIYRQMLIIILYISSVFTSVKSVSQLVLSRSVSILAQLMSSSKKSKSLLLKFLFLIWWFCFSSTIFMFVSILIILWPVIDVSVMIIYRVS